jgi:hypothetical protein
VNELRKQIGQMLMVGLASDVLKEEELALLRDFPVGGFILFNITVRALNGFERFVIHCGKSRRTRLLLLPSIKKAAPLTGCRSPSPIFPSPRASAQGATRVSLTELGTRLLQSSA